MLDKIKKFIKSVLGKDLSGLVMDFLDLSKKFILRKDLCRRPDISIPRQRYGSDYGGWWVATEPLNNKKLNVLSFGLGEDLTFDINIMNNFNCKIYGFDPTPKAIKYINSLNIDKSKFHFFEYAISDSVGILEFNLPYNDTRDIYRSLEKIDSKNSIKVKCKNIATICAEIKVSDIDIFKMDIEGSEYRVIEDMMKNKIFPRQILVEYHHFFPNIPLKDTKKSIELLSSNGYDIFCIELYNYSFIRRQD